MKIIYVKQRSKKLYKSRKIIAVIYATFAVVKKKCEKKFRLVKFKPLTSAILVQCSTNKANKSAGSRSLNWLVITL